MNSQGPVGRQLGAECCSSCEDMPIELAVVFKVLRPVAPLDVFDDVGFEELPEQLQRLVTGHLGPKVAVAPQQLVEEVHSLGSGEAPVVAAEVGPVAPQRHASTEELDGFIPLWERRQIRA